MSGEVFIKIIEVTLEAYFVDIYCESKHLLAATPGDGERRYLFCDHLQSSRVTCGRNLHEGTPTDETRVIRAHTDAVRGRYQARFAYRQMPDARFKCSFVTEGARRTVLQV